MQKYYEHVFDMITIGMVKIWTHADTLEHE